MSELIEHDPALVHAQYWYTQPIHFAVYANRPAVVRALLEAGTEPGRTRFMDSGWKKLVRRAAAIAELREAIVTRAAATTTPDFAEEVFCRNDLLLAELLLRTVPAAARRLHGGSLRRGDPNVCVTSRAVLERMIEAGFDPNRPDWLGKTALHHYAGRGDTDNARLMIEHGADPDALDDEYRGTPLAWAARQGHEAMVRFLLGRGADPARPHDLPPATPLARARSAGHDEIVAILGRAAG